VSRFDLVVVGDADPDVVLAGAPRGTAGQPTMAEATAPLGMVAAG
jgi:hypothetical protein